MQALIELSELPNLEIKVVTIPQWSGGAIPFARLVHSKYMIVDGKTAWLGSENWQGNYFTSSRNVGTVLAIPSVVQELEQIFQRLWKSTYASSITTSGT